MVPYGLLVSDLDIADNLFRDKIRRARRLQANQPEDASTFES
jgi:hypothetical protein